MQKILNINALANKTYFEGDIMRRVFDHSTGRNVIIDDKLKYDKSCVFLSMGTQVKLCMFNL